MIAKKLRISREKIPYILKKGESYKSKLFIVKFAENNLKTPRFRVIVSKKINKKAVKRNRIRRQIYESIRLIEKEKTLNKNYDIIFIPRKHILKSNFQEIFFDLKNTLCKI